VDHENGMTNRSDEDSDKDRYTNEKRSSIVTSAFFDRRDWIKTIGAIGASSFLGSFETDTVSASKKASQAEYTSLNSIEAGEAWSGVSPGFAILTYQNYQFISYYNPSRNMTVAKRRLGDHNWETKELSNKFNGYDNHNYITMALDQDGHLHVSGNMHYDPLVYFRSDNPLDIQSLSQEGMTGIDEQVITYPKFLSGPEGELVFYYRSGVPGDGIRLFNKYNSESQSWSRLVNEPLLDGEGKRNSYPVGPVVGPNDWYHLVWVWRESKGAENNRYVSYARSPNLVDWETADGTSIDLPITIGDGDIIDPVPVKEGLINGNTKIGFDSSNRTIVSYHKYDSSGNTQIYNARREENEWKIYTTSDWDYRWEFGGGGSLGFEIDVFPVENSEGKLTQRFRHIKYGKGEWVLDSSSLQPVETKNSFNIYPESLSEPESEFPGIDTYWYNDINDSNTNNVEFALRHEALPANRDKPRNNYPDPTTLRVHEFAKDPVLARLDMAADKSEVLINCSQEKDNNLSKGERKKLIKSSKQINTKIIRVLKRYDDKSERELLKRVNSTLKDTNNLERWVSNESRSRTTTELQSIQDTLAQLGYQLSEARERLLGVCPNLSLKTDSLVAGKTTELDVQLQNGSDKAITNLDSGLSVPSGWSTTQISNNTSGAVRPGSEDSARFKVDVPIEQAPVNVGITGENSYKYEGAIGNTKETDRFRVKSLLSVENLELSTDEISLGSTFTVTASIKNDYQRTLDAELSLQLPDGWKSSSRSFSIGSTTKKEVKFEIVPSESAQKSVQIEAVLRFAGNIIDKGSVTAKIKPIIVWDFDTDGNTEGWEALEALKNFQAKNGKLRCTATGNNPQMQRSGVFVDLSRGAQIEISMTSSVVGKGKFFWATTDAPGYAGSRGDSFRVEPANEQRTYAATIPPQDSLLNDLRLDPIKGTSVQGELAGNEFTIDQIRVYATEVVEPEEIKTWEFDTDGDTEGWKALESLKNFRVENGALRCTATGANPQMEQDNINVDLSEGLNIKITMSSTVAGKGKFFWATSDAPGYSGSRGDSFQVTDANESETYTATIPPSDSSLTSLRLDPIKGSSVDGDLAGNDFVIDQIKLLIPINDTV